MLWSYVDYAIRTMRQVLPACQLCVGSGDLEQDKHISLSSKDYLIFVFLIVLATMGLVGQAESDHTVMRGGRASARQRPVIGRRLTVAQMTLETRK